MASGKTIREAIEHTDFDAMWRYMEIDPEMWGSTSANEVRMLAQRLCKDLSTDPRPDAIRDCGGILVERDWEYGEKPGYRISFIDECWRLDPEEHDPGATATRIFSKGQAVRVESS